MNKVVQIELDNQLIEALKGIDVTETCDIDNVIKKTLWQYIQRSKANYFPNAFFPTTIVESLADEINIDTVNYMRVLVPIHSLSQYYSFDSLFCLSNLYKQYLFS